MVAIKWISLNIEKWVENKIKKWDPIMIVWEFRINASIFYVTNIKKHIMSMNIFMGIYLRNICKMIYTYIFIANMNILAENMAENIHLYFCPI